MPEGSSSAVLDAEVAEAAAGLRATPKVISGPRWFYNAEGCRLFEKITRSPEYYLTHAEDEILRAHAGEIAHFTAADTLVELGPSTYRKSHRLLAALRAGGTLRRFLPFHHSEANLQRVVALADRDFPDVETRGIRGSIGRHLELLPLEGERRLIALLGSSIGTSDASARVDFLQALTRVLRPGDALLLGVDLVKEISRLERAYNDGAGLNAAFNRNALTVLNRKLNADFVPERFMHVATWDPDQEWMDIRLRSECDQRVRLGASYTVVFTAGEDVRTEISAKFRRNGVEDELADGGLEPAAWWTDSRSDFALSLSIPRPEQRPADTAALHARHRLTVRTSARIDRSDNEGKQVSELHGSPERNHDGASPELAQISAFLGALAEDELLSTSKVLQLAVTIEEILLRKESQEREGLLEPLCRISVGMLRSEQVRSQLSSDVAAARARGTSWLEISRVAGIDPTGARKRWDPKAREKHRDYQRSRRTRDSHT